MPVDTASIPNPDAPTRMRWHRDATKLMQGFPRHWSGASEHLGEPRRGTQLRARHPEPSRPHPELVPAAVGPPPFNIDHCGSEI